MKSIFKFTVMLLSVIIINGCSDDAVACIGCDGSGTGAANEVVLTLENTDIGTFDIVSFTQDIADATNADLDQIVITSVNGFNRSGVYVSFYFEDSETDGLSATECLSAIQTELQDGSIGSYTATIIITNTDDDFICQFVEDCAGICNGDTVVSNCGECGGVDNTPNEGICDCAGEPYGESELDNCGVCDGGDEDIDICGVCFGNGSSCDLGALVDTYYLNKARFYLNPDCSGSPIQTLNGPEFHLEDSYNNYNGSCSYSEATYNGIMSFYLDLAADGTYGVLVFDEDIENYEYCYESWNSCDNGECSSCSSDMENTSEVEIEFGEWSLENGNLRLSLDYAKEFKTGTYSYVNTNCGEVQNSSSNVYNGCLDDYAYNYDYGYDYGSYLLDGDPDSYELSGNRLIMRFVDYNEYDYGYDYYDYDYDYDDWQCVEYEWKTTNSWPSVEGCTNENSIVYNPFATSDDGSCGEGNCYYYTSEENISPKEERKSIFYKFNDIKPKKDIKTK